MTLEDRDYCLKRAGQEDEAALAAASLTARWRHEELAGLYRLRAAAYDRDKLQAEIDASVVPAFILAPTGHPKSEAA